MVLVATREAGGVGSVLCHPFSFGVLVDEIDSLVAEASAALEAIRASAPYLEWGHSFHVTAFGIVIFSETERDLAWVAKNLGVARVKRIGKRTRRKWLIIEKPLAQMPMLRKAAIKKGHRRRSRR